MGQHLPAIITFCEGLLSKSKDPEQRRVLKARIKRLKESYERLVEAERALIEDLQGGRHD